MKRTKVISTFAQFCEALRANQEIFVYEEYNKCWIKYVSEPGWSLYYYISEFQKRKFHYEYEEKQLNEWPCKCGYIVRANDPKEDWNYNSLQYHWLLVPKDWMFCPKCSSKRPTEIQEQDQEEGKLATHFQSVAELKEKHWCMCLELSGVFRDGLSTCSKCSGKDAYGGSPDRPKDKIKGVWNPEAKKFEKEEKTSEAEKECKIKLPRLLPFDCDLEAEQRNTRQVLADLIYAFKQVIEGEGILKVKVTKDAHP